MFKEKESAFVTGVRLDYEGEGGKAIYSGNARLWQGETEVQGATIELDEQYGNLRATGSARSNMILQYVDRKTQTRTEVPSVATAEELFYEDALHRVTYTTNAHVTGPQGDLTADKV